jgi:hypothetical protein
MALKLKATAVGGSGKPAPKGAGRDRTGGLIRGRKGWPGILPRRKVYLGDVSR